MNEADGGGPGCAVRDGREGRQAEAAAQIQGGDVGRRKRAVEGQNIAPRVAGSVLRTELRCGGAVVWYRDGVRCWRELCGGRSVRRLSRGLRCLKPLVRFGASCDPV